MRAKDVFTPTGLPTVTFVDDHLKDRASRLRDAIDTGGLLISLVGPSKSGKTVFIEEKIGRSNLVHITGAGVTSASQLWMRVFDKLGTPISVTRQSETTTGEKLTGSATAGLNWLAKGELGTSAEKSTGSKSSDSEGLAIDCLQLLIRELKDTGFVLFIDDFHYIAGDIQPTVAEQVKEAVRSGLSIITASVPYHSDDVIRSNRDLSGRIIKLDFDYWGPQPLLTILSKGFGELNASVPIHFAQKLVAESAGSPQLMQALALNLCFAADCRDAVIGAKRELPNDAHFFKRVCEQTSLMTDFSTVLSRILEGPKTRGKTRTSHNTADGGILDVYPIVVRAIQRDPPCLNFRYSELIKRIEQICPAGGPSGSSVTGACEHIAKIANESLESLVMEWDSQNDVLDIRDPYLLFYLRWSGR